MRSGCRVNHNIGVCSGIQKLLDQGQRISRYHPWKVRSCFHVAPIDRPEERSEPLRVGLVHIGMAIDQERCNIVASIEERKPQSVLAVPAYSIDVRPRLYQKACRLNAALTRRKHEWREQTAGELLDALLGFGGNRRRSFEASP